MNPPGRQNNNLSHPSGFHNYSAQLQATSLVSAGWKTATLSFSFLPHDERE